MWLFCINAAWSLKKILKKMKKFFWKKATMAVATMLVAFVAVVIGTPCASAQNLPVIEVVEKTSMKQSVVDEKNSAFFYYAESSSAVSGVQVRSYNKITATPENFVLVFWPSEKFCFVAEKNNCLISVMEVTAVDIDEAGTPRLTLSNQTQLAHQNNDLLEVVPGQKIMLVSIDGLTNGYWAYRMLPTTWEEVYDWREISPEVDYKAMADNAWVEAKAFEVEANAGNGLPLKSVEE